MKKTVKVKVARSTDILQAELELAKIQLKVSEDSNKWLKSEIEKRDELIEHLKAIVKIFGEAETE